MGKDADVNMTPAEDDGTEGFFLNNFHRIQISTNVRDDAWVIYSADKLVAMTRKQWQDQYKGVMPTYDQFARNGYLIHASVTGNEALKINGAYGKHDYMPPQVFINKIPLSQHEQAMVDTKTGDEKNKLAGSYRWKKFRKIADQIGIPAKLPKYIKSEEKGLIFETNRGGSQYVSAHYEEPNRAGHNIPNIQVWSDGKPVDLAWHTPGGTGKYDGKSLDEVIAAAKAKHGADAKVVLKARNNRLMGTEQLDHYEDDGANKRWESQVGRRARNTYFSNLSLVIPQADGSPSFNVDVKWTAENDPDHELINAVLNGRDGDYLRIIASGHGRTTIGYAMKKFPTETRKLLKDIGIPDGIVNDGPEADKWARAIGETLPAVSVPHEDHRDGAPSKNVDVMKKYTPDQIMIAIVDEYGNRNGGQRTLGAYQRDKLRLPDDAAEALGLDPEVYSKTNNISRNDRQHGGYSVGF